MLSNTVSDDTCQAQKDVCMHLLVGYYIIVFSTNACVNCDMMIARSRMESYFKSKSSAEFNNMFLAYPHYALSFPS